MVADGTGVVDPDGVAVGGAVVAGTADGVVGEGVAVAMAMAVPVPTGAVVAVAVPVPTGAVVAVEVGAVVPLPAGIVADAVA